MKDTIKINFYDRFKCTGSDCPFNCCQEWKIAVDDETVARWQGLELETVSQKEPALHVCKHVKEIEEGYIIALNEEKQCPFLNEEKLCRLVIQQGEEALSETCTTFPRQIKHFKNRTEYALAACCPVVLDLLHEEKEGIHVIKPEGYRISDLAEGIRSMMLSIMADETYLVTERILMIFYMLLDLLEKRKLTLNQIERCGQKDYITPIAEAIRQMPFNLIDQVLECNELFLDVVENYRKQGLYVDFLEEISERAEDLEVDYTEEEILALYEDFEAEFLAYEHLMQNYLISELFGNMLVEDMSLEDLVVAYEWLGMEYVTMRQAIFLKWLGEESLQYEMVRDYMMVIARITGYDQEDIREYLENSFESLIWDWGYLAMIVGNSDL